MRFRSAPAPTLTRLLLPCSNGETISGSSSNWSRTTFPPLRSDCSVGETCRSGISCRSKSLTISKTITSTTKTELTAILTRARAEGQARAMVLQAQAAKKPAKRSSSLGRVLERDFRPCRKCSAQAARGLLLRALISSSRGSGGPRILS